MQELNADRNGLLAPGWDPPQMDDRPNPARIYDYLIGGKNHFAVDREAARAASRALPELRLMARANRAFLGRAVRFLAEAGIDQFLDIGTGIPGPGNVGEIARAIRPQARVVYVDYDPMVVAHCRVLLSGSDPACTGVLHADLRDTGAILDSAVVRGVLDFDRPIAVLMAAVLHFVRDEDARGIVARLTGALAPGSAVALSHAADGTEPDRIATARQAWDGARSPLVVRTREEILQFFDGIQPVAPGVVGLPQWRPDGPAAGDEQPLPFGFCGVGFKP